MKLKVEATVEVTLPDRFHPELAVEDLLLGVVRHRPDWDITVLRTSRAREVKT